MGGLSICRTTHALYPDMVGGHAIFCHELSARQAHDGHRIEVFTTLKRGLPSSQLVRHGYRVTRLKRAWMPWDSLGMSNPLLPSIYGMVGKPNWDLVDAHSHLFLTTALSVKAAIDAGKPIITTVHGFLAQRDWLTNLCQRCYLSSLGRWALRNSSRVVCLTRSDAEQVAGLAVARRKIRIIPIAVDPSLFRPDEKRMNRILWIGRLVAEKGLETLLEAIAKMQRKSEVRITIVGEGPERNKLFRRARQLGILHLVNYRCQADRFEVTHLLRHSQIFVLPSYREGLPMTLLEAMSSANTIVASNLASISEVLGEAGLYFTPGESGELADVLLEALDDGNLCRTKGRLARERIEERYSWNVVLPKLEHLYEEVVAG